MIKHKYEVGELVKITNVDGIAFGPRHFDNGDVTEIVSISDKGNIELKGFPQPLPITPNELYCIEPYVPEDVDLSLAAIEQSNVDNPVKPVHYHHGGIDVFAYGEANFSKEAVAGFYRMNIIKYVTRYDKKNGLQDLEKAEYYLKALMGLERGSDDK